LRDPHPLTDRRTDRWIPQTLTPPWGVADAPSTDGAHALLPLWSSTTTFVSILVATWILLIVIEIPTLCLLSRIPASSHRFGGDIEVGPSNAPPPPPPSQDLVHPRVLERPPSPDRSSYRPMEPSDSDASLGGHRCTIHGWGPCLSYPVFMPKPSTHRMHDPGSNVSHIRPKGFTENQMS
jgi:hypothetical protein